MIDVIDSIRDLIIFNSEDDFYFLQILQRKKENPQLGSNSRVIKNYYISSIAHLESRYDEIKNICQLTNARAMLRLNKRSYEKVAFKTIQNVANCLSNREYEQINKQYDRACGEGHNDSIKKWIVDLDGAQINLCDEILEFINDQCKPNGYKLIKILPTKNGIHLITSPFDQQEFKKRYTDIEVHKDNPINLYIP